ncbi:MAG TPA: signal peptide prediction [Ramlibacter sp.]|nr:signal peptide prediction [Ramlibacter sp.]
MTMLAKRLFAYAWAAPWSALGLAFGMVAWLLGARAQIHDGALEFGGGRVGAVLSGLPGGLGFSAITFVHVILGLDHATLAQCRAHEQAHVRQYERWGPFFIPAYLLSSLAQLVRGRRPYRDNFFEREAYECCPAAGGRRIRV